jgi:hypothetical protein
VSVTFEFKGKIYSAEHAGLSPYEPIVVICLGPVKPTEPKTDGNIPWFPPAMPRRPDGFECMIWHRGRWRHVKWVERFNGWQFGYATAHILGDLGRLFAPLPWNTPEADFWEGEKS